MWSASGAGLVPSSGVCVHAAGRPGASPGAHEQQMRRATGAARGRWGGRRSRRRPPARRRADDRRGTPLPNLT
eukprot:scaffold1085_cov407-Prasinococcus_capsulatus_cf.AAC.3